MKRFLSLFCLSAALVTFAAAPPAYNQAFDQLRANAQSAFDALSRAKLQVATQPIEAKNVLAHPGVATQAMRAQVNALIASNATNSSFPLTKARDLLTLFDGIERQSAELAQALLRRVTASVTFAPDS
jgi:hypothetical protein